ncbi:MAG: hypothetical protein OXI13_14075, partial [Gammaproteobacteria bacterium]|nr:hypothetical protein [Gammaproteobacteria bacterium]
SAPVMVTRDIHVPRPSGGASHRPKWQSCHFVRRHGASMGNSEFSEKGRSDIVAEASIDAA